jgi:hypothetical protein
MAGFRDPRGCILELTRCGLPLNRYNVGTVEGSTEGKNHWLGIAGHHRTDRMQVLKGLSMEKWLCWGAMGVAGGLGLLFVLDFVTKFPFGGLSKFVDVIGIIACGIVFYLGWDAFQDQR